MGFQKVVFAVSTIFLLSIVLRCAVVSAEKVLVVDLSGKSWTLRNENGSQSISVAQIPSGVFSVVGDVLRDRNDVDQRWIAQENWTYVREFELEVVPNNVRALNLTLFGVDAIATVRLNDLIIGTTDNMFLQYSFSLIPSVHLKQNNILEIELMSPLRAAAAYAEHLEEAGITLPPYCEDIRRDEHSECYRQMLRKMQLSFGTEQTPAVPSLGIWRRVVLEMYEVAILRDVDIAARLNDTHWILDMRLHLATDIRANFYANVTFLAADLLDSPLIVHTAVSYVAPVIEMVVPISKDLVQLWWPNGYGDQKLYPFYFMVNCWLNPDGPNLKDRSISDKFLHYGFRTIELVEDLDDYGRSFYFKVNNKPIFVKGASYFPSHILPEKAYNAEKVSYLLKSAKDAHMNMIRVWGGGLYESETFYNYADTYGLLVWQDMTFTEASYPVTEDFIESVSLETIQNARRMAYHPSLAFIVTNDEIELFLTRNKTQLGLDSVRLENEYKQLFVGTIKYELNEISRDNFDPRPGPMLSTPSRGIQESLKDIGLLAQDPGYGDIHFQEEEKDLWDPDVYPRARFISEIGVQSLPNMCSWNRSISEGVNISEIMKHRQHNPKHFEPLLKLIKQHLPVPVDKWESNVKAFIYASQVAQAMAAKVSTELFRSQRADYRTMGVLFWHLNDVWVAPTSSMIDFDGNYKLIYYWSKHFLAPIAISALYDSSNRVINVTVVQDDVVDAEVPYEVTVNTYLWSDLHPRNSPISIPVTMNSQGVQQFYLPLERVLSTEFTESNCFLELLLSSTDDTSDETTVVATTFFMFPGSLKNAVGITDPGLTFDLSWCYCTANQISSKISYNIRIKVNSPAIFVKIDISHPNILNYTLSDNGFNQVEPVKYVHLEFASSTGCFYINSEHVSIQTMNTYMLINETKTTTTTQATPTTNAGNSPEDPEMPPSNNDNMRELLKLPQNQAI